MPRTGRDKVRIAVASVRSRLFRSLGIGLAFLMVPSAGAGQTADELVDRVLEAYGGWARLDTASSYRMEGTLATGHGKALSRTERVFARPRRLKVVLEHPDVSETRIVDGRVGWRADPKGAFTEATGPLLDSMRLQGARAGLPWTLAEERGSVRLGDPLDVEGRPLPNLEVSLGPGLSLRAGVDPKTGRILAVLAVLDSARMKITFETRYSDFKEVDGVLFAHVEQNYTGGRHQATTVIEKVTLNPPLGDGAFRP